MARVPTTHDPFNAIAEPKRRQLLEALGIGERSVNDLVELLGWPQPMVSKHLGVLKQVGLVKERRAGRQRLYQINAAQLKPIHDWIQPFQRLWTARLDRLEQYLIELQSKENQDERSE